MPTEFDAILNEDNEEPCDECGAEPGHDHASWCLAPKDEPAEDDWAS